jgi:hypothetical protein
MSFGTYGFLENSGQYVANLVFTIVWAMQTRIKITFHSKCPSEWGHESN